MLGLMTNDEYLSIEPNTSYISINLIVGETQTGMACLSNSECIQKSPTRT